MGFMVAQQDSSGNIISINEYSTLVNAQNGQAAIRAASATGVVVSGIFQDTIDSTVIDTSQG